MFFHLLPGATHRVGTANWRQATKAKTKDGLCTEICRRGVEAEEGTGSYMASVDRQVDEHFQRIKGTTKEMKEQIAEVKAQASEREIEKDDQNKQSEE